MDRQIAAAFERWDSAVVALEDALDADEWALCLREVNSAKAAWLTLKLSTQPEKENEL